MASMDEDFSMESTDMSVSNDSTSVYNQQGPEELESESAPFHFESDHIALQGNPDYQQLLKTIVVLEGQKVKAIKDLEVLIEKEKEALEDPISFVNKLQNKVDIGLPTRQTIPDLPEIEWERYTSNLTPLSWKHKHVTRHKRSGDLQSALVMPIKIEPDSAGASEDERGSVRGRLPVNENKKVRTFNTLWTAEEQKRLEELLISFPPEDVEMRRWEKIAKELGNRTPHQVQSRTQKYFIKLAKLGLPIPGRMPNVGPGRGRLHRHHRNNRFYFQSSTFLASHEPPVYMSDEECDTFEGFRGVHQRHGKQQHDYCDVSDEEDVPMELRHTEEYRQILQLKRMKSQKLKAELEPAQHVGFRCDRCECEPIVGTRWHCSDCPDDTAVDFCDDCVDFEFQNEHHNSSHNLKPFKTVEGVKTETQDTDYKFSSQMPGGYNYLDPNFMPAS